MSVVIVAGGCGGVSGVVMIHGGGPGFAPVDEVRLRDEFAKRYMESIFSCRNAVPEDAERAYEYADLMMASRSRKRDERNDL